MSKEIVRELVDGEWVTTVADAGGGGSLPAGFAVDANATLTQSPVDQTGDSPFINLVYDPAQLVDESNLGLLIDARPQGADPGDGSDVFQVGINVFSYRAAPEEGAANFRVLAADHTSSTTLTASTDASLTLQGDDSSILRLNTDGTCFLPNLPTSDPHVLGQLWNNAGALKVSAGPP